MRSFFLFVISFLFFVALLAAGTVTGRIVGVTDGDTVKILTADKKEIKVRLYGVDCPEKAQAFGQVAKKFTSDLAFGKDARVEVIDTDRYDRSVGIVKTGERSSVNEQLVAAGLAWRYAQYCKREPLCTDLGRLEQEARTAKRGLWADQNPVAPWQWRKDKKRERDEDAKKALDKGRKSKNRPITLSKSILLRIF